MFLYSIEGSIPARAETQGDKQELARRICVELKRFDWEGTIKDSIVSFINNRNVFHQMVRLDRSTQAVDSGEFVVDREGIRYRLVTSYLLFWTAILVVPLAICLAIQSFVGVAGVIGYWLLFCVGSSLWLSFRIRRALRRAVSAPSPGLSP